MKFLFFTCTLLFLSITLHAQQLTNHAEAKYLLDKNPKELKSEYRKSLQKGDTVYAIQNILTLSKRNRITQQYSDAFYNAGEALFLSEFIKDTLNIARAHTELGKIQYLFKQDAACGEHFHKANDLFKKIKHTPRSEYLKSYFNILLYYQHIDDAENMMAYIDTCNTLASSIPTDKFFHVFLQEKKSSILKTQGKFKESIQVLKHSIDTVLVSNPNHSFLIILYGSLATRHNKINDIESAKRYFQKATSIKDKYGENTFYKSYLHTIYARLLDKKGDYKLAYKNLEISRSIDNRYLNTRNVRNKDFLTIKNRYREQLFTSKQKINQQQLEILEKEQEIILFRSLILILLFTSLLIGVLLHFRKKSLNHKRKQQESEEKIALNNKELTTNVLQLIEKESIINSLKKELKSIDKEGKSKGLLLSIEQQSNKLWDSFNNRFIEQNKGFYERLQKKAPNLSAADLKLCALIKLNFSGQEMAYLLGISLGSVHVARHRLRKKIDLDRKINLTTFMASI